MIMRFQKTNRSAYLNYLHSKYEAWSGEIVVQSSPYIMGIDPSSICQLRCPICPTGVENESRRVGEKISIRNRTMLESDLFIALLDEVGEKLFYIMFYNWGEPLLNKRLPDYLRKTKSLQICTEIHTNLSFRISDEYMQEILTSGVDIIAASIDGFSQENYQQYRRGGNFDLCLENITRLATMRDRLGLQTDIIWNFLVFSFNEHEIDLARKYCEENGITFNQREAYIDKPEWLPSYRREEANASSAEKPAGQPSQKGMAKSPVPCSWHYNYSLVNADGSVSPCCAPWEQIHDFGHLRPGLITFGDIWNNPLFQKSRAVFAEIAALDLEDVDTLCMHCPYDASIQNLYSYLDNEVEKQFFKEVAQIDPLLEHAFHLLSNRPNFLKFYRQNLLGRSPSHPIQISLPRLLQLRVSRGVYQAKAQVPIVRTLLRQKLTPSYSRVARRFPIVSRLAQPLKRIL